MEKKHYRKWSHDDKSLIRLMETNSIEDDSLKPSIYRSNSLSLLVWENVEVTVKQLTISTKPKGILKKSKNNIKEMKEIEKKERNEAQFLQLYQDHFFRKKYSKSTQFSLGVHHHSKKNPTSRIEGSNSKSNSTFYHLPNVVNRFKSFRKMNLSTKTYGRLALSKQSARFELPIDIRLLQKMSTIEYLCSYCRVSVRRNALYKRIFEKLKDGKDGDMSFNNLILSLKEVHSGGVGEEQLNEVFDLIELDREKRIDYELFIGIASFLERILYHQFVTEDTEEMPDYQKDNLESADFQSLPKRCNSLNMNKNLMKLLQML
ncbi:hypothetical protein SNEBB_009525 [Seison nebaliae]|nr:hypothetical protein SNEBB_009525 [Seison nebaliae]